MRTESFNQIRTFVRINRVLPLSALIAVAFLLFGGSAMITKAQSQDSAVGSQINSTPIAAALNGAIPTPTPASREQQQKAPVDFNGDGKTDYAVVRSADPNSPSFWYINTGSGVDVRNGQQWGTGIRTSLTSPSSSFIADVATPADFDGDGKTDVAVWRRGAQSYFYILQSSNNTFRAEAFGETADDPRVVADYDGDGKADLAVYRRGAACGSQNYYYYRPSGTPGVNFRGQPWGIVGGLNCPSPSYAPYVGDFDGDGKGDFAVIRYDYIGAPAVFYILKSSGGIEVVYWGLILDYFIPGDYDGDGKTDICAQRDIQSAKYYFIRYANGATQTFVWGIFSSVDVPGDYNGDGRTDIASYDSSNGRWSILPTTGAPPFYFYWGQPRDETTIGDIPIANYAVVR